MHQNKRWVPYESATPNFERQTWEIQSVLAASPIFKKVGVSEQKLDSLLAYSSKYQKISLGKFLPIDLSSLFKPQQQLNPKKLGGKHGQKPQHNPKGNCTAEWSQFLFCSLIMLAKISWFFQPIPVFVGNLAQNSTRFSLSNEPFLLIKSRVFFFCVHANNILSTPLYLQNHCGKNLWACFPFLPKLCMFSQRIFGKSKFSTRK